MTADVTVDFTTVDTAPTVVSTSPTNGATDVASGATITVTFSEPVTADAGAFTLECPAGTTTAFAAQRVGHGLDAHARRQAARRRACAPSPSSAARSTTSTPSTRPTRWSRTSRPSSPSPPTARRPTSRSRPRRVAENQPSGTAVGTFSTHRPRRRRHLHLQPGRRPRRHRQRVVHHRRRRAATAAGSTSRPRRPTRSACARPTRPATVLREVLHHHGHRRQRGADRHRAQQRLGRRERARGHRRRHARRHRPRRRPDPHLRRRHGRLRQHVSRRQQLRGQTPGRSSPRRR